MLRVLWFGVVVGFTLLTAATHAAEFVTHAPTRPLPTANQRPLDDGPHYYVDPRHGDDQAAGSAAKPWRSVQRGVQTLQPGDTLVLRGGTYYEHVSLRLTGTVGKPITLRAHPGEIAIVDGGLREFYESPQTSWEPCPNGAVGEYWSTKPYPGLSDDPIRTNLLGNFGDSLVPLHGYRFRTDLTSDNPYWNISSKVEDSGAVYTGPGLWYDTKSHRIHCRLAHTKLPGLGEMNYRGETDPRKLPLVVAHGADRSPLALTECRNIRLQDLVVRGARGPTVAIHECTNITLDGLTIYGGSTCVRVKNTARLVATHTACRGLAAPWTFRGSLKYRAIESQLFSASSWDPSGHDNVDFELSHCEFTDSVDGVFVGQVRGLKFHHNLVENVSDDAMFLTAATGFDGSTHGGDVQIYQNRFARNLTCFAFGVGHGRQKVLDVGRQTGVGAWIYRNVFDFRQPVMYRWPSGPNDVQELDSLGRIAGDHGSPIWEPMWIYHNTILAGDTPRYDYGTGGMVGGIGKSGQRRVLNNIFAQKLGTPGQTLPPAGTNFVGDGNLFWSYELGESLAPTFLSKLRANKGIADSKQLYPAGWATHDQYADPKFNTFAVDHRAGVDLRLSDTSPALDKGVALDEQWPDPLRAADVKQPDLGAVPCGIEPWRVGVYGRLDVFGNAASSTTTVVMPSPIYPPVADPPADTIVRRALVVQGYPAFDAPLVAYCLRRAGFLVETTERVWVEPARFKDFDVVAYDGSMARAKIEPNKFSEADYAVIRTYLEQGGQLLLMRERHDLFAGDSGQKFLSSLIGSNTLRKFDAITVQQPDHPWLKHLGGKTPEWLPSKNFSLLRHKQGTSVIGAPGASALLDAPIGRGRLLYVGWVPSASIPHGRVPGTVDDERRYEEQVGVLQNLVQTMFK